MNNKQSSYDTPPIKILDLARFDRRITGKRKAPGQSLIDSAIKGGMLRRLFHFIGVIFGL
ncbi:MAG TPA: hypothetical protein DCZ12_05010 [Gammaproteobacteria bacterium]|nr:hypothetical protein CN03_15320 [Thalassolituus oleivorans]MAR00612.1 hypothetical protein [Oceanospirillaceae bacterium]PCI46889.1 MAG: hypothetical protein COB43_13015 [Oceanospirillales bacterium]HBA33475.1 hypothetical protein [Gammaproteobacteria bacterium]